MFSKSADVFPFAKNLAQNALENIFQKSVEQYTRPQTQLKKQQQQAHQKIPRYLVPRANTTTRDCETT
jgi:hypothetical protein